MDKEAYKVQSKEHDPERLTILKSDIALLKRLTRGLDERLQTALVKRYGYDYEWDEIKKEGILKDPRKSLKFHQKKWENLIAQGKLESL